jgi:hypothetical protein
MFFWTYFDKEHFANFLRILPYAATEASLVPTERKR